MANIKSQIKRNRQNEERRQRNKATRSALKTRIKRFDETVGSGDADAAQQAFRDATKALDKAAAKGVLHKNTAANKKSRLAKRLQRSG
jgi:small subunit ribosomal protein S20